MRLLELDTDSGSNPQAAVLGKKHAKKPARKAPRPARSSTAPAAQTTIYPLHGNAAVQQPVRRQPIDLEQLQQRIEILEKRMRQRERAREAAPRIDRKDIEQLKQRMKLLERSMHNELWSAHQREHALLEMLARPPLTTSLRMKGRKLLQQDLPATGRKLHSVGSDLWQHYQPTWWPQFIAAWQESLARARGNPPA